MREGSEDGEKLINNGCMSSYNESDQGDGTATSQKQVLAFGFYFCFNF
jgi:hypothetical protein